MEEKIKIYLDRRTIGILDKDTEQFDFMKKNGSPNRNLFLNTLLKNYFDLYQKRCDALYRQILASLDNSLDPLIAADTASDIVYQSLSAFNIPEEEPLDQVCSLKPTSLSTPVLNYIRGSLLAHTTLSAYLRSLFVSYASMPQDEREKIIFLPLFSLIEKAAMEKHLISFNTSANPRNIHFVLPYKAAAAREELYHYMLGQENGRPVTFRISRMQNVILTLTPAMPDPEVIHLLDQMAKYGPQFSMEKEEETVVRLTYAGAKMYRSYFVHRPAADRIEDDLYYFHCSAKQLLLYFSRFGKEAEILSPAKLREAMIRYHQRALTAYKKDPAVQQDL